MKPEKALELAIDAHELRDQKRAAKKHGVSQPTVSRAVTQVANSPELNAIALAKKKELAEALQLDRLNFLKDAIAEMRIKIPDSDLRDVAGAYKIVADHHEVAQGILNERQPDICAEPNKGTEEVAPTKSNWLDGQRVVESASTQ